MALGKPDGDSEEIDLSQVKLPRCVSYGELLRADEIYPNGILKKGLVKSGEGYTWEGEFTEDGSFRKGKKTFSDGTFQQGEWGKYGDFKNGLKTYKDGMAEQGEWENDKLKNGTRTLPNGFVENVRNRWTVVYADEFSNRGIEKGCMTKDGVKLTGKFRADGILEEGTKTLQNGDVLSGSFVGENQLVKGTITTSTGTIYEGVFIDGLTLTNGKITSPGGTTYEGKFNKHHILLEGTMILPNGSTYKGIFYDRKNTHALQRGSFFDARNRTTYEGEFNEHNTFINGQIKREGGEVENFVHGLIIVRADEVYPDGRIKKGVAKNGEGCLCDGEFDTEGNLIEGLETDTEGIVTKVGLKHTHLFGEISGGTIKHKAKVYPSGALAKGIVEVINAQNHLITYNGTFYENGNLRNGTKKFYPGRTNVREETGSFYPNGKIHKGSITKTEGTSYEGEWDENGTFLNGSITDDEKPPKTRQIIGGAEIMSADEFYPDGSLKKGSIKFLNGNVYEGDFNEKRELVHGTIKLSTKPLFHLERRENDKLIGKNEFSEGIFDQQLHLLEGKRFLNKSPVEEGLFDKHEKLTKGKMTLLDGTVIKGDFSSTGKISKGSITKTDNTVIEGDFDKNGNIQTGSITKPDGTLYRGDFYPAGSIRKGTVTKTDKMVIEGDFDEQGVLTNGTVTKPDGGIIEFIDGIEKILPKESAYQGIKKSVKSKITRIVNEW